MREDARLVAAAANAGRISVDNCTNWMMAMKADRPGTRRTLASLTPVLRIVADAEAVEAVHGRVMARLGLPTGEPAPRTVEASSQAPPSPRTAVDDLGAPISPVPPPVRLVHGKDPATWTQQERDDAALWALGPAFRAGLKPPPGGDAIYQPSPKEPYRYDESEGRFVPKDRYLGSV